ncbi:centromere protein Cenp-K [Radiomyces spectabilis]|uniref:centromere protein Cenp-K n=1 Tax=Radiomyces spectabilis TaxID=64574 RepID=UPI00221EAC91|nr:centromere protein Cenp-K [Radiomyces spectabilis]KAI8374115.1 centromere protein Cenp-K [Radiomyces spectabilis]
MWFEEHIKSLISQAADDFDDTVAADTVLQEPGDGGARDQMLDQVLAAQKAQREQLWQKLHELEDTYKHAVQPSLCGEDQTPEKKLLSQYMYEERELSSELEKQMNDVNVISRPSDQTIVELQFKESLFRSTDQLHQALAFIEAELKESVETLQRETAVLKECKEIRSVLTDKLDRVRNGGQHIAAPDSQMEKIPAIRQKHNATMGDLIDFLDMYYPPHPCESPEPADEDMDGARDPNANFCELKFILEDLMNQVVMNPSNPYITLEPGTYWPPYIETLVKAGIALRHPEDSSKIRLADFRL